MSNSLAYMNHESYKKVGNVIFFPTTINKNDESIEELTKEETAIPSSQKEISSVIVEAAEEHDAEPIKNIEDIMRISDYFLQKKNYRNNLIWIIGINTGLRCSDLRKLRVCDFINENSTFKDEIVILEQKTKNTRKKQKNRHITINKAIKQALSIYLENTKLSLEDYLFRSQSNNGKNKNTPISRQGIESVLKEAVKDLDIGIRAGTHCLRKTFGYQFMIKHNGDPRALQLLQKIFGHSSSAITLRYIGITSDEIEEAYLDINLGLRTAQIIDSDIVEKEDAAECFMENI